MGPIILYDKSVLHALSTKEMLFLEKHFHINLTAILFLEIIGDLTKQGKRPPENGISSLADKISPVDSVVNADFRSVLLGSLMGIPVPMEHRILVSDGVPIIDGTGSTGWFIDEQPEFKAIRQWQQRNFTEAERLFSIAWRKHKESYNLQQFQQRGREFKHIWEKVNNIAEARMAAKEIIQRIGSTAYAIKLIQSTFRVPKSYGAIIMARWQRAGRPALQPYS